MEPRHGCGGPREAKIGSSFSDVKFVQLFKKNEMEINFHELKKELPMCSE
jgi:hypothetical protein